MLWTRLLVLSKSQNFIGTMDSASEKKFTRHLKVFRKLSRSSEEGFMKKAVLEHKGLVREIQHL